jgi:hypothetical protein
VKRLPGVHASHYKRRSVEHADADTRLDRRKNRFDGIGGQVAMHRDLECSLWADKRPVRHIVEHKAVVVDEFFRRFREAMPLEIVARPGTDQRCARHFLYHGILESRETSREPHVSSTLLYGFQFIAAYFW